MTYDFVANTDRCVPLRFICYPTVAPSPLDIYSSTATLLDKAVSLDGRVTCAGIVAGLDGLPTTELEILGTILAFRYTGSATASPFTRT